MSSPVGEVTPSEAWRMLVDDPNAVLVDVRTRPEWQYVGHPDLTALGRKVVRLSWQHWPGMETDPAFVEKLKDHAATGQTLLFLCRSGVRSMAAAKAATDHGFTACFNVAEGFEGARDAEKHRGTLGGWRRAGLPWVQE